MAIIIDGKKTAAKLADELKTKTAKLDKKPSLAVILANDSAASAVYVASKEKKSKELGFNSFVYRFEQTVKQNEIKELIEKLNKDPEINAILVQLPLFSHLSQDEIIELIDPRKDVDGFHPVNAGRLSSNLEPYAVCCTPKGIIKLLEEYDISLEGKNAVVIGRSNIVGKPLAALLLNKNATVTIAHSKTKNLKEITKNSDIIISAAGHPGLVTADMVSKGAVVIDVGITKKEGVLMGDVDFNSVSDVAGYITPVPGGVGPMTIAALMENTYELYMQQNKKA